MSANLDEVLGALEPPPGVPARVIEYRPAPVQTPARPPIPFAWAEEFRTSEDDLRQVVEGVITEAGTSIWYGESNSGKTYLVLHLAYCVSTGTRFFGKRVERGAVIYIAAEGAGSVKRRVAAFEKHHAQPFGSFGLISTSLTLMDPSADVEDLIDLIKERASEIGEIVQLIVVDTVARAMGGANENASEDMSRLVAAFDRIRDETGAHVLGIHHSGKDTGKGARGHSSLRAAVDTEVEVTADEVNKIHTGQITKQRDLPTKGARFAGRFVSVNVGRDQWQGVVTACAVEDAEPVDKPVSLRGPQQAVMAFLAGQQAGVSRVAIVKALAPQGVSRPSVYRAINTLLELDLVTETLGMVYMPKV